MCFGVMSRASAVFSRGYVSQQWGRVPGLGYKLACNQGSAVVLSGVIGGASTVIRGGRVRAGWLPREAGDQQAGGALPFFSHVFV